MKRAAALFLTLLAATVMFAQTDIRGDLRSRIDFSIPGENGYESLLNPANVFGITDVTLGNNANLRFEGGNEAAALEVRLDFRSYPIAETLVAAAGLLAAEDSGLAPALAGIADLAYLAGDTLWSADLSRASVTWFPSPAFLVSVGRQGFSTGYGFGWTPLDLVNIPGVETSSVDGLAVTLAPLWWTQLIGYAILPSGPADWEDVVTGAELTVLAGPAELKGVGQYDGADEYGAAAGVYLDVLGLGVYAEGAVRSRSRRTTEAGPFYSGLVGLEYVTSLGVIVIAEYFYNGEGWDEAERSAYASLLESMGPTGENAALYTPGYFSEHYALMNLAMPVYAWDVQVDLGVLYSIDSGALLVAPAATINLDSSGNLSAEVEYMGVFSLLGEDSDEASLSPVKNGLSVALRYSF